MLVGEHPAERERVLHDQHDGDDQRGAGQREEDPAEPIGGGSLGLHRGERRGRVAPHRVASIAAGGPRHGPKSVRAGPGPGEEQDAAFGRVSEMPFDRTLLASAVVSAPPTPSSEDAPRHPRTFSRRRFLAGSAAVPLSLVLGDKLAAWAATPPKGYGPQGACGLPPYILNRIWRGYDPKLSGQIIVVPHGRNFLGAGAPHASPWPYTQDVPMFFVRPGRREAGHVLPARSPRPTSRRRWHGSWTSKTASPGRAASRSTART